MFGSRLRERRIDAGLSQVELAERVGIRAHTLWRYEADQNMPSARVLQRIAEALGTTVDVLLTDGEPKRQGVSS
jgi:Predicted transcriptional regulators